MKRIISAIAMLCVSLVVLPVVRAEEHAQAPVRETPRQPGAVHTVYGVVGDGTAMHSLSLVMPDGEMLWFGIGDDTVKDLKDGLLVGKKVAVTYRGPAKDDDSACIMAIRIADA